MCGLRHLTNLAVKTKYLTFIRANSAWYFLRPAAERGNCAGRWAIRAAKKCRVARYAQGYHFVRGMNGSVHAGRNVVLCHCIGQDRPGKTGCAEYCSARGST
jgi:hypothetical protein